jgi:hypothetical protein
MRTCMVGGRVRAGGRAGGYEGGCARYGEYGCPCEDVDVGQMGRWGGGGGLLQHAPFRLRQHVQCPDAKALTQDPFPARLYSFP